MITDDHHLKSVWGARFRRSGGSDLPLWDDWDSETKADALGALDLEGGELPVVLIVSLAGAKTLLTTRRLFTPQAVVRLAEIVSVQPPQANFRAGNLPPKWTELEIGLAAGQPLQLSLSPGGPYFGLFNVLLVIVGRNRRRAPTGSQPSSQS